MKVLKNWEDSPKTGHVEIEQELCGIQSPHKNSSETLYMKRTNKCMDLHIHVGVNHEL